MLRVSPLYLSFRGGSRENERTIMGNIAIVVDLPDIDELEQVYRLDASEIKPEGMPSEDVPAGMPSEDQPAETPPGIQPAGMPSEDQPAETPPGIQPAGMPSEDVPATPPGIQPAGMPSEDVPEGMPSEDEPEGMPSEDQPAATPPGIRPEGMPSELQNRSSVAGAPGRLPSRWPGKPTRRGFFGLSHRTH